MEHFTQEELAELRARARALAEVEGTNPHWVDAYWKFANAADRLEAMIAHSTIAATDAVGEAPYYEEVPDLESARLESLIPPRK